MAYHDDLLAQAVRLVHETPESQASLRRAVSTAYYAVFHMLVAASKSKWSDANFRNMLGRAFDHGTMARASGDFAKSDAYEFNEEKTAVVKTLRFVSRTFSQLQEQRHFADYDLSKNLTHTEALAQVLSAKKVLEDWQSIQDEEIAQAYLLSLLFKSRNSR